MKKLLFVFGLMLAFGATAQKVKVESGNYKFLKGESEINVEFDYSNLTLMKDNLTEEKYVEDRKNELNKKEAGKGDAWEKEWNAAKEDIWEPKFLELVNIVISKKKKDLKFDKDLSSAKYTLIVEVKWIYPGWDVVVSKKPAELNTVLKFVETENKDNVVLELSSEKAPGAQYGSQFSNETRIGESFAKTGKTLGGLVFKKGLK
ncbi:MAG: hypothetical protein WED10_01105 [Brumimicrobium sp.]